jgi:glycerophosphoryl diester phosphodiesterase
MNDKFSFIARRGASADAPDNTLRAFELAVRQESDMIETDVQMTQDKVLARIIHDPPTASGYCPILPALCAIFRPQCA